MNSSNSKPENMHEEPPEDYSDFTYEKLIYASIRLQGGYHRKFHSEKEFNSWCQAELEWLNDKLRTSLFPIVHKYLGKSVNFLNWPIRILERKKKQTLLGNDVNIGIIKQLERANFFIARHSSRGIFLDFLISYDPEVAASYLLSEASYLLSEQDITITDPRMKLEYEKNLATLRKPEIQDKFLESLQIASEENTLASTRFNEHFLKHIDEVRFQNHKENIRNIQEGKKEIDKLTNIVKGEIKLRAGENLWGRKKAGHSKVKNRWFATFGIGVLIALVGLVFYYQYLYSLIFNPANPIDLKELHTSLQLIFFFMPIVLVIWLLRIPLSNYRRQQSYEDDAEERHAMILTFKALEYNGRASDEERALILNALFRSNQVSTEDRLPTPVWEAIIKRLEAKKDKSS